MEDLVTKLIAVSPIAAALIIMTVLFLKYLRSRDKEWADTVKFMSGEQIKIQDSSSTTVRENTLVLGKVEKLLDLRIKQVGNEHG